MESTASAHSLLLMIFERSARSYEGGGGGGRRRSSGRSLMWTVRGTVHVTVKLSIFSNSEANEAPGLSFAENRRSSSHSCLQVSNDTVETSQISGNEAEHAYLRTFRFKASQVDTPDFGIVHVPERKV